MSCDITRNRNRWSGHALWLVLAAAAACQDARRGGQPDDTDDGDTDDGGTDTQTETIDTDFPNTIPTTCAEAAAVPTSVGCEFFMAQMANEKDNVPLIYAVVISNPQEDASANVELSEGTVGLIYTATLAPGQLEVVNVACDSGCLVPPHQIEVQGIAHGAGFRLASDVPVAAFQWNPYEVVQMNGTTDASLLLPSAHLDGEYLVAAWGIGPKLDKPTLVSQVTVVATEDDTNVTFVPSTDIADHGDAGPYEAGVETESVLLDAFDVMTLSPAVLDDDITGTTVRADRPLAVFGGHVCAQVPSKEYGACDHVEEQLLPLSAWGTASVLARHAPRHDCESEDLALWRIIAGTNDMRVTFDPPAPSPAGAEYHFAKKGDLLEFLAPEDTYAEGLLEHPGDPAHPEAPFLAYQLMTGATFPNCYLHDGYDREGDPFMLLSPPAGQYLDRYVFNTAKPAEGAESYDFEYDHIIIVRPPGSHVVLDCKGLIPDSEFTGVGASGWEVARIAIDNPQGDTGCADGAHLLTASAPVGLSVVGTATDNSYGYLGGVGLRPINPVVE